MKRKNSGLLRVIGSIKKNNRRFYSDEIEEEDLTPRFKSEEEKKAYYAELRRSQEEQQRQYEYYRKLERERKQQDPTYQRTIVNYCIELAHELGKKDSDNDDGYETIKKYEYQFDNTRIIHDYYYKGDKGYQYSRNEYLFVFVGDEKVLQTTRGTGYIEFFSRSNWTDLIESLHHDLPTLKEKKKKEDEERKLKDKSYIFFLNAFDNYEELKNENGYYFSMLNNLLRDKGIVVTKCTFTYDKVKCGEKKFVGYKVECGNERVLTYPVKNESYRIDKDTLLDWYKPARWQNDFIAICKCVHEEYMNRNSQRINDDINKSLAKLNKMHR